MAKFLKVSWIHLLDRQIKLNDQVSVELILVLPDKSLAQNIQVNKGTTVGEIKKRDDMLIALLDALKKTNSIAINGKKVHDDYKILQDERLVILRHLFMDPKEMRRRRINKL